MKKWLVVWLGAAVCAVLCTAAAIFTSGWLRVVIITTAAAAWIFFLVRFCLLKYTISDSEITVSGGLLFKYYRTIKRSAILSQSRLYIGKQLVCTVIRTAGSTNILYCSLSEKGGF